MTALVYFPVTGYWRSVEDPLLTGDTNDPDLNVVSGLVLIRPRLPSGFTAYVADLDDASLPATAPTAVVFPVRQARIWEGELCTINPEDTPGIQLLANMPELGLAARGYDDLIYDVSFTGVVYDQNSGQALSNFAFASPTDATAVCITDPQLERLTWEKPKKS